MEIVFTIPGFNPIRVLDDSLFDIVDLRSSIRQSLTRLMYIEYMQRLIETKEL